MKNLKLLVVLLLTVSTLTTFTSCKKNKTKAYFTWRAEYSPPGYLNSPTGATVFFTNESKNSDWFIWEFSGGYGDNRMEGHQHYEEVFHRNFEPGTYTITLTAYGSRGIHNADVYSTTITIH